jgi:hypothetical protein
MRNQGCGVLGKDVISMYQIGLHSQLGKRRPQDLVPPAVVAIETRCPFNQLCISSAIRSLGQGSAV